MSFHNSIAQKIKTQISIDKQIRPRIKGKDRLTEYECKCSYNPTKLGIRICKVYKWPSAKVQTLNRPYKWFTYIYTDHNTNLILDSEGEYSQEPRLNGMDYDSFGR